MDLKKTGRIIAQLRKNNGYTQESLAEQLNISPQAISKWETGLGLPEASLLSKISDLFNTSIDEIIQPNKKYNKTIDFFNRNLIAPMEKVLDYIPKIERWATLSGTHLAMYYSMPATIAEALCCAEAQETGDPQNINHLAVTDRYQYLMHIMGIGYGFLWLDNKNMINELWRVNDFKDMIDRAMKYFGRDYLWLTSSEATGDEMRKAIVLSISKGRPVVMEWAGNIPEFSIVTGYEDLGNTLIGWTYCPECTQKKTDKGMFISPSRWNDVSAMKNNKYKLLVIGDKNERTLSDRETIEYALRVLDRTESVDKDYATYIAGDNAYKKWLEACDTSISTMKINAGDTFFSFYLLTNSLYAQKCTIPYYRNLAITHGTEIHDIVVQLQISIDIIEKERLKIKSMVEDIELYTNAWRQHITNMIKHREYTRGWLRELQKLL